MSTSFIQGILQYIAAIVAAHLLSDTWQQMLGIFLVVWAIMPVPTEH